MNIPPAPQPHTPRLIDHTAQRRFFSYVYIWIAGALMLSGVSAILFALLPFSEIMFTEKQIYLYMIALFIISSAFFAQKYYSYIPAFVVGILFFIISALFGSVLSFFLLLLGPWPLISILISSVSMFAIMALYGYALNKDTLHYDNIFLMVCIGMICAAIFNLFFQGGQLYWYITFIGVAIFACIPIIEAPFIRNLSLDLDTHSTPSTLSLRGALSMYMIFMHLAILALIILGSNRRNSIQGTLSERRGFWR